jgi:hypothetical protein
VYIMLQCISRNIKKENRKVRRKEKGAGTKKE